MHILSIFSGGSLPSIEVTVRMVPNNMAIHQDLLQEFGMPVSLVACAEKSRTGFLFFEDLQDFSCNTRCRAIIEGKVEDLFRYRHRTKKVLCIEKPKKDRRIRDGHFLYWYNSFRNFS